MGYLIAAVAATAGGPFLYGILHERPGLAKYVDLFVYLMVPLLVLWQILPTAWEERTVLPVLALGAGFAVPLWIGRLSKPLAERADVVTLVLVLSGLLLHALFEGAGLATVAEGSPARGMMRRHARPRLVDQLFKLARRQRPKQESRSFVRIGGQFLLDLGIDQAGHGEKVRQSVVIEILHPRAPADISCLNAEARADRNVVEEALAVVPVQDVRVVGKVRLENVERAVEIEIPHAEAHPGLSRRVDSLVRRANLVVQNTASRNEPEVTHHGFVVSASTDAAIEEVVGQIRGLGRVSAILCLGLAE